MGYLIGGEKNLLFKSVGSHEIFLITIIYWLVMLP